MSEKQNEKHPLLIVTYMPWKVWWRIFFPYSLFCLFGFSAGRALIPSDSIANSIIGIFFYGMGILGIYIIVELLMTESFIFYTDKIVKVSRLFGNKEMKFMDSILGISPVRANPIFIGLADFSFYKKVVCFNIYMYNKHISIDRTMISKNTENRIMDFVSKHLNLDIREKHKGSRILNFDLKNYNI